MGKGKSGIIGIDHQAIFDANPDVSFILAEDCRILDANLTAVERYGYSLDELKQMTVSDLAPADLQPGVAARLKQPLKSSQTFEWRHRCKDGRELPVEIYMQPITVHGKRVILCRAHDISRRRKLEEELQNKQHLLERIVESEPGTVYINDLVKQQVVYVNRDWFTTYGYTTEETQAMAAGLLDIIHPDDLTGIAANNKAWKTAADAEMRTIEYRVRNRQGDWHWLISHETPFNRDSSGSVCQILGIAHDITERKRAETELRERERDLEQAQAIGRFGSWTHDMAGHITWSDEVYRIFGVSPDTCNANAEAFYKLIHPEDLAALQAWNNACFSGLKPGPIEWRCIRPDGSVRYIYGRGALISDTGGRIIHLAGSVQDITERKQMEAALHESEEKLRLFIRYVPSAVAMFDRDMRYIAYSRRWLTDYGLGEQELAGRSHYEVFPDIPGHWKRTHRRCMDGLIAKNDGEKILRKDGSVDWVRWETHPWRTGEGEIGGIIIFSEVITERKLAEAKFHRLSQLYAALGQCNQAIVRCTSEAELLAEICRNTVDYGGMKMAWIGMVDEGRNMVVPVASFGTGTEYLDGIEISLDPDSRTAGGPTFMSIRENRPYWIQDFQHDPATAPWRERAARFDWGASASLPLYRKGVAIGAFGVYSGEANAFDEQMQDLLVEMASDISFALENFDTRIAHNMALEQIKFQNTILQTQQENSLDAVLVVDENGMITSYNRQFLDLWQLQPDLVNKRDDTLVIRANADQAEDTEAYVARAEYLYEHRDEKSREEILLKDGRVIDRYSAPMIGSDGKYYGRVWYFRDITEQKHAEERISFLANFDALTGLPNRAQLDRQFRYALNLAKRNNGRLAVMFVDIDRFKDINDTLGHSIGDALLVKIARRIQAALRETDTVSRMGGDEFILMLSGGEAHGVAQVAQKLLQAITEPYRIEQYDLVVTASIGIAMYPDDGDDLESLSRNADTAMYRAKQEGRNRYRFFTAEMQASAARNMQLVNALRSALERDQFQVYYQPQVSISDGRIIGAEALLRWRHPELGNVSPAEFIPVAEDSGLILPIGEWVMRTAVKQLKRWMDSGHPPMVIAVNLSAVQFRHPSLPDMVTGILNDAQLDPEYLELELTEGVAMHDPLAAISTMQNLHELGIRMSIDDFGTGYSSLNYLKKFQVYKLKIDQSFVRDISTDQEDKAIVAAIISMSKNLGLQTIAEGVESAEQLAYLREQGCDEAQGYYFSKPLAADQMEQILERGKGLPVKA